MKTYYIYGLIDPTTKKIRYVGVSMSPKSRLHQHLTYGRKQTVRMCTAEWIADLIGRGLTPTLEIYEQYEAERKWYALEVEKQWIYYFDQNGMPLLNRRILQPLYRFSKILPGQEPIPAPNFLLLTDNLSGWFYPDS